ncbi:MAG: DbpA RNA binding domain-containing protein, partial [Bacteroidales bacterium]
TEKGRRRIRDSKKYTRFFVNIGKKDGLAASKVIGLVNDHTRNRDIAIGEIDLKDSFSFFEVDEQFKETIKQSLHGKTFNGRKMAIEVAEARDSKKKGNKRKR